MSRIAVVLLMVFVLAGSLCASGAPAMEGLYQHRGTFQETLLATRAAVAKVTDNLDACLSIWVVMEKDFPVQCDWMQQDAGVDCGKWLGAKDDAHLPRRLAEKVVAELPDNHPLCTAMKALPATATERQWLDLYVRICEARRAIRLRPVLEKSPRIVFAKHANMGGSHYAYTEAQSDAQAERNYRAGSALCVLEMKGIWGEVTTLIDDPHGVIRNPDVSFDGRRILFAWKKSDRLDDYHLYEMDAATKQVRQLTYGLGVADYEGCYLPDGSILFNSSRCVQTVDCWWTEVSNLYTCDKDGQAIRRLTFDQVHNNFPTVAADGRILYTRWEYNDRGQIYPQPLFVMNADGTGQTEFYGNNSFFPTTILHARSAPDSDKVLAIATGHHSRQAGKLIVIDPTKGTQEADGVQLVAPVRPTKAEKIDAYGQQGDLFQHPYPLSETEFLITYHPAGWRAPWNPDGRQHSMRFEPRFGIYFMTIDGRRELLASDPQMPCNQPIPLAARKTPVVRPGTVDYRKNEGVYYVQDVHAGPGLEGVTRGTIKTLRVVALDFRVAGIGSNGNNGALISTPIAVGNGAWDVKRVLGDATVHDDGSALFTAPARTPVYFQLLDEKGRMVQTMRSWSTLQPGETASCVGCHESKHTTPLISQRNTRALGYAPETLRPFYGEARGFSFAKEVQPILDAKCISCHDGTTGEEKSFSLLGKPVADTGSAKRYWSDAYLYLTSAKKKDDGNIIATTREKMVNWISAQTAPPMLPPYSGGSATSVLMQLLEKEHKGVRMTKGEMEKIAAWIDLGVPFCGDYAEAANWDADDLRKHEHFTDKRHRFDEEERRGVAAYMAGEPAVAGPPVKIELLDSAGVAIASGEASLKLSRAYKPGDRIRITGQSHMAIRMDAALPEAVVYAPKGTLEFSIPTGKELAGYSPSAFAGDRPAITARPAAPVETRAYRNLALNPIAVRGEPAFYPHASSNNEYANSAVFAARCAIDGNTASTGHGRWPHLSWGPDRGNDSRLRIDFGRPVMIDKLIITPRGDFPHDSVWPEVRVEFSDGHRETLRLASNGNPQTLVFRPRPAEWIQLIRLDLPNDKPWRALTEIQAWGCDASEVRVIGR